MANKIIKIGVLLITSIMFCSCMSAQPPREYYSSDIQTNNYSMRGRGISDDYAVLYDRNAAAKTFISNNDDSADRMITYSVSLHLSVKQVDEARKTLIDEVKNAKGFVIQETENSIRTRIPSEKMDDFINNAKKNGNVENIRKTGTDITEEYRDNAIRLENLKKVRERYLTLLEKADAVIDILSIEKELERVNTEIEIFEGRIKYAEQSVTYSHITIFLNENIKPGPIGWIFYGIYVGVKWLFVW